MEIHIIIIRPKNHPNCRGVQKAGCIELNEYRGPNLKPTDIVPIFWKQKYIHARAESSTSVAILDIPPNIFARLFSFGFSVEILKNNQPIYFGEWQHNSTISNGFYLRLNLEKIQQTANRTQRGTVAVIYSRQKGIYPENQEVYRN